MAFWKGALNTLLGAAPSAALGFLVGGPAGALIAGGLGGLAGATSKSGKVKQVPTMTPQQKSVMDFLLAQGQKNADFSGIENLYKNKFSQEIIPELAERFTSMGEGGTRSSGFQAALGMAGSDLATKLAALRAQHGMRQLQMGMTPQFQNITTPGKAGFGQNELNMLLPLMGLNASGMGKGAGIPGIGSLNKLLGFGGRYAAGQPTGFSPRPWAKASRFSIGG